MWLEANALFVVAFVALGVISLALIPTHLNQDGWLALIGGRYVAAHGIPHHDALNVLTHGARWIDQQWLAQLAVDGLDRLGGLALYSIAYVGLTVAAFAIAVAAARALGGTERHVLWLLPIASFLYLAGAFQIRTQGFAYPLFVAVLWLLAEAVRSPGRRRVYWVFPLLILWGNMHGSATLGAAIGMLYGATLLLDDLRAAGRHRPRRRLRGRTAAFLIVSPLCLFANPYGFGIVTYYDATLLNSSFSRFVTEWQPVTSITLIAVPFFVLAFTSVWILGRSGARTPLFDQLTLVLLAFGAISAIRNVSWFGLAALVLMPRAIGAALRPARIPDRRPKLNLTIAGFSVLILVGATIAIAVKPASWFERKYDHRAAIKVAAVLGSQPGVRVFADIRYSDWLLWHNPALAGHLAYDTRLELLTNSQINDLANPAQAPGPRQPLIVAGYGLLVLDPTDQPTTRLLLDRPGTHVVLRGKDVVVATASGA